MPGRQRVFLYDQNARQLYFQATTNLAEPPDLQNLRVPEESTAGWVARNRMPRIVNQAAQDARHFAKIDMKIADFQHELIVIAVPMVSAEDKLIGVLEVLNKA